MRVRHGRIIVHVIDVPRGDELGLAFDTAIRIVINAAFDIAWVLRRCQIGPSIWAQSRKNLYRRYHL